MLDGSPKQARFTQLFGLGTAIIALGLGIATLVEESPMSLVVPFFVLAIALCTFLVGWRMAARHKMTFGVAEYEIRDDGSLHGTWTIRQYNGKLGKEIATGGRPGHLPGRYMVNIYGADGSNLYGGTLTIKETATDKVFDMIWEATGKPTYIGLGILAGPDRLAANYRTLAK